jgi:hypothetical protein
VYKNSVTRLRGVQRGAGGREAQPQHELGGHRAVEDVIAQHAAGVVHLQHLAERAGGQTEQRGLQEDRAEGFPGAQLGHRVVGGGADHREERAVVLTGGSPAGCGRG